MRAFDEIIEPGLAPSPHRAASVTRRFIEVVTQRGARLHVERMRASAHQRLEDHRAEIDAFEQRLHERWGLGIDLLDLYRLWCLEAGETFHARHAPAEGDWAYYVLVRLQARACLVTAEVLALLRAGLASGAHSRWRSIHEIAVVAFFIAEHGQETAERYVRHEAVDSYRAAITYQLYAERLDYEPLTAAEIDELRVEHDRLVSEYGSHYRGDYGWAAHAIGHSPKFTEIEAAVSLDHLRPLYKMASHPTHAGPKGIAWDVGLLRPEIMLAGPSNAGLAEAAQGTVISLFQVTVTLLRQDPDFGDLVTLRVLEAMCDAVQHAFVEAHEQLVSDDARIVDAGAANDA
jgi:hypothetical protein